MHNIHLPQLRDLITVLEDEFTVSLSKTKLSVSQRQKIEEEAKYFIEFAKEYLAEHRVRGIKADVDNYILALSNGTNCTISSNVESIQGTMAPVLKHASAVAPNLPDIYANQGAVPISGNVKKQAGLVDYSDPVYGAGQSYVDKSQKGQPRRFDTRVPVNDDILQR